ncbi:M48 family metallopeptidase [Marinithermus hydrothermalis]|uniref:YgjP-like metallopeptidase domain-containing protein n=1 Tax=Marinithermus hydrothermalis (strain DSM 14884 / JCM 11576 / T1) TaxID=869210 RepID=F2NP62_MARHT|nr:M48 family metallopeptidase [Marinithermus hydrothermalis]AEB11863.1 protein of unknown function DUF45 [Marinithermus hydrothermalis DSM 14884]
MNGAPASSSGDAHADAIPRDVLISEVRAWARRMGVENRLREIHVRPMKRKWASISTRGRLTLNSDLLRQSAAFRRQVLVHELVHLKLGHGAHNKLFRSLVRAYLALDASEKKPGDLQG